MKKRCYLFWNVDSLFEILCLDIHLTYYFSSLNNLWINFSEELDMMFQTVKVCFHENNNDKWPWNFSCISIITTTPFYLHWLVITRTSFRRYKDKNKFEANNNNLQNISMNPSNLNFSNSCIKTKSEKEG